MSPLQISHILILALVLHARAHPFFSFSFSKVSTTVQNFQDQSWLWGWAWGTDTTVSVVDRSPPVIFLSRPAGFGTDLSEPLLGYVIPLNSFTVPCSNGTITPHFDSPNLGCPSLCSIDPNIPERLEPWIALVQRGACQFVSKAREAQKLGAKAIVVGGEDPAVSGKPDTLVNMFSPGESPTLYKCSVCLTLYKEDASDVTIAATYIKYSSYAELYSLIASSNTSQAGLKTVSLLISSEFSAWQWYSYVIRSLHLPGCSLIVTTCLHRPILTFLTILFIPSSLTFLTLVIHRIRAAHAAQRERAPENVVKNLPWRVWTGSGWEKHEGVTPDKGADQGVIPVIPVDNDVELGQTPVPNPTTSAQTSEDEDPAWFNTQVQCAICLDEFVKGDRVRVLPCKHIFHLDEVDEWLIQLKKLVRPMTIGLRFFLSTSDTTRI
jgi:RING-like zinc finger